MAETRLQRAVRVRQTTFRASLVAELTRVIEIEGISLRALGRATGVDPSQLARFLRGQGGLSHASLVAVATGLGYDVSLRLFETVGPRVIDHVQARMIEALLAMLHPRWIAQLEVAVYRPVRGVIDLLLQDRETWDLVTGEGHSALRSAERQLRWAAQKADALDSARGWPWAPPDAAPAVSRLLLLRSSAAHHDLVATLPETFANAYPAPAEAAFDALRLGRPWPAAAILWVDVAGAGTRVLGSTPRAVRARTTPRDPVTGPGRRHAIR
jgi:transcriptional regulator with XRE-family HTH domain